MYSPTYTPQSLLQHTAQLWVGHESRRAPNTADGLLAEKRPSIEGLVDNVDPRDSTELQDLNREELPKYEQQPEAAPLPLKEKLITCFWIALNTISTLGLIFLSKRYAHHIPRGMRMV